MDLIQKTCIKNYQNISKTIFLNATNIISLTKYEVWGILKEKINVVLKQNKIDKTNVGLHNLEVDKELSPKKHNVNTPTEIFILW